MMRNLNYLLILLAFTIISEGFSQELNRKAIDEKKHSEILIGLCNRAGFATCGFDSAYRAGYSSYEPGIDILNQLPPFLKDIKITVVMGTWCGDSKEHVPHFYKILDLLKFDFNKLTLICVDRSKTAPETELQQLKIERVPTFIFYRKNIEIGRIVETPEASLEKDMLRITSGK
jgi:hypothetical protein